jgi:hypothetical protein
MTANDVTKDFLLLAAKRFPDAFMWRNNRVNAKIRNPGEKSRYVKAGINGQADISGCFPVTVNGRKFGIRCEIEIKAGDDVQSKNQINFEQAMKRAGGIYIIVREAEAGVGWLDMLLVEMER